MHELRPDRLGHPKVHVCDLCRLQLASSVDVASHIFSGPDPPKRRVFPAIAERAAVHDEHPRIPLGRSRQVFLGDDVAVAAQGLDHLVQI